MIITDIFIFISALFFVVKSSSWATKYAENLANGFRVSKYTIGFLIVALISILPETIISLMASLEGNPSFGLGVLLGSNTTDLTLIMGLLIFLNKKSLKVESNILKSTIVYPFILLIPIILGFDGYYSRPEGFVLILVGLFFYYFLIKKNKTVASENIEYDSDHKKNRALNFLILLISMIVLLISSHFTLTSAINIANFFHISPVLIALVIVGVGTTMPEFFFSLNSLRLKDNSMAIGDILGTVLADATIVIGILASMLPFHFPVKIIYISGMFMFLSSAILFYFMKTGKKISLKEAYLLISIWFLFVLTEFLFNL